MWRNRVLCNGAGLITLTQLMAEYWFSCANSKLIEKADALMRKGKNVVFERAERKEIKNVNGMRAMIFENIWMSKYW